MKQWWHVCLNFTEKLALCRFMFLWRYLSSIRLHLSQHVVSNQQTISIHHVWKKVVLTFGNNLANRNQCSQSFQRWKEAKFYDTLIMLLHYLVKYSPCYYCALNDVFLAVPNDQQILLQFIDILNTQLVDMPLMMPQIVYATGLGSGLFDLVQWTEVLLAAETKQCRWLCVG